MIKLSSPDIKFNNLEKLRETIGSSWIVEGLNTKKLENKFKKKFKKKFCVFFNSWTTAAYTLFLVLNLKKGSEVILPSYSFIATANAPLLAGYKLKFVDVDFKTQNISPKEIKKNLSKNTKVILSVDQFGNPCDQRKIHSLAKKRKIIHILDSACSFGSLYEGKDIGRFSDFMIFSFHARKIITSGEGGAILTNNKKIYKKLILFKNHGMNKSPYTRSKTSPLNFENYIIPGLNFRYTDIQASILDSQFSRIKKIINARRKISKIYDNYFKKNFDKFIIQNEIKNSKSNKQSYIVVLRKNNMRNKLINFLYKKKIEAKRAIPPIHKQKYYQNIFNLKLKNTEILSNNGLLLPLHSKILVKEINYIIKQIKVFSKNFL